MSSIFDAIGPLSGEGYHAKCLFCGAQNFSETRKQSLAWRQKHFKKTGGDGNGGHDEYRVN